jgi:hypothetical protein
MEHNPFEHESGELVSISSGLVADSSVTCDLAVEKGIQSKKEMEGKDFRTLKLKRNNKVTPLASMNSGIKVQDNHVVINTQEFIP